jgi:hypothetical protein
VAARLRLDGVAGEAKRGCVSDAKCALAVLEREAVSARGERAGESARRKRRPRSVAGIELRLTLRERP